MFNSAVTAVKDESNPNRLAHGYQLLSSACIMDSTYGEAHYQTGNTNSDLNHWPAAVACWKQALACENSPTQRAKILCNLGWRLHCLGKTEEAWEASHEAATLDPSLVYVWVNLSLIHGTWNDSERSIECAKKAYSLAPNDPTVEIALAFALLFAGRYQEGFKHFECRFRYKLKSFLSFPYPKWEGEAGKTVYLVADQGIGDTISFSRFVEAAAQRARYIHAAVQPELLRLFTHAFLHLQNVNVIPQPNPFPQADAWSTFVSLPSALKLTDQEIKDAPHIRAIHSTVPVNWKNPDRKFHIGIAWAGSPLNEIDKHRNIPVTQFLDLYRVPGIQLYSLQVGDKAREMHDQGCMALIRDLTPYIRDVVDTLSILKHLDLVITCESALGHICALAEKDCFIPYSYLGKDYRAGLRGDKKLWTPKTWFVQQGPTMRWDTAFDEITNALRDRVVDARAA